LVEVCRLNQPPAASDAIEAELPEDRLEIRLLAAEALAMFAGDDLVLERYHSAASSFFSHLGPPASGAEEVLEVVLHRGGWPCSPEDLQRSLEGLVAWAETKKEEPRNRAKGLVEACCAILLDGGVGQQRIQSIKEMGLLPTSQSLSYFHVLIFSLLSPQEKEHPLTHTIAFVSK